MSNMTNIYEETEREERALSRKVDTAGWAEQIDELKRFREDALANRKAEDPKSESKEWEGFLMGVNGAIHRLQMTQPNASVECERGTKR